MPERVDLGYAVTLPPERAIAYFRSKGYALTWSWRDMSERAHALGFTVAKSAGYDILGDIRGALDKALAEGQSYREFASDDLVDTLRLKGWWGRRTDPDTGRKVQLGSPHRLKTIFRTNIRTAMATSRYEAMKANAAGRPFWMYDARDDSRTRASHAALDNLVFRHDDPFWESHYPPNGFNCRCRVRAFTERDLEQRGLEVSSSQGRLSTVEQDFGTVQTQTQGYQAPGGEVVTPDPGFGARPFPELQLGDKLVASMRSTFERSIDAGMPQARRAAARVVASLQQSPDAARAELRSLIARERGQGVELKTLRPATSRGLAVGVVERMRELSRLLPAAWVERMNLGPGVTVRVVRGRTRKGGDYSGLTKTITINGPSGGARGLPLEDNVLIHEMVHHLQEMHPDLDGLFYAFHRRRGSGEYSYNPFYAHRSYDGSNQLTHTGFGAVLGQIDSREGVLGGQSMDFPRARPLEVMTTALEALLTPGRYDWLGYTGVDGDPFERMARKDPGFFEFVVGVVLGHLGP